MKRIPLLLAVLCFSTPLAQAAIGEGRSLPSGEEHPEVIMQIYTAPQGEVQFTEKTDVMKVYMAHLRLRTGALASLKEVHGERDCKIWNNSSKTAPLPVGCEFLFRNDEGSYFNVQSEDMKEASLFQAVKGLLKGPYVAL